MDVEQAKRIKPYMTALRAPESRPGLYCQSALFISDIKHL
jgi:hypothetical protein